MNTSRVACFVSVLIASLFVATAAHAAVVPEGVVNVDFGVTSFPTVTGGPHSPVYSGLAAGPATVGTFWNELAYEGKQGGVGTFGPTGSLKASDGATTIAGLTVTLNNVNFYHAEENQTPAPNGDLLNDYAYGANSPMMTISGLLAGNRYDLYLYSENGNYQSGNSTFTVNGGAGLTANNALVPTSPAGSRGAFTLGGNYVVFSGLTGVTTLNVASSGVSPPLNGFQLVALPEPSSAIVLAIGVAPLLRRRRVGNPESERA